MQARICCYRICAVTVEIRTGSAFDDEANNRNGGGEIKQGAIVFHQHPLVVTVVLFGANEAKAVGVSKPAGTATDL